jgi:hypothetical protein
VASVEEKYILGNDKEYMILHAQALELLSGLKKHVGEESISNTQIRQARQMCDALSTMVSGYDSERAASLLQEAKGERGQGIFKDVAKNLYRLAARQESVLNAYRKRKVMTKAEALGIIEAWLKELEETPYPKGNMTNPEHYTLTCLRDFVNGGKWAEALKMCQTARGDSPAFAAKLNRLKASLASLDAPQGAQAPRKKFLGLF